MMNMRRQRKKTRLSGEGEEYVHRHRGIKEWSN
jgi:hypothetical protein